mgnify:CR=1 FL=1
MKTELIIRSNSSDIDFALLKDGKLTALNNETNDNKFSVGDIFLAKIGKVLSGLNASFVDVGYEKDGFLHYHDLGAQLKSLTKFIKGVSTGKIKDYTLKNFQLEKDIDKNGSIVDVLKTGQNLLVQIVKEPISTKGPRMSSEISIAGRYLLVALALADNFNPDTLDAGSEFSWICKLALGLAVPIPTLPPDNIILVSYFLSIIPSL